MHSTLRTLIVDDDPRFRQRVRDLLAHESGITVVGEAVDGMDAITKTRELEPDLILLDIRMPGMNGLDAARQLKAERPELKILILSLYDLEEYRSIARANGVNGYIVKHSLVEELLPVIHGLEQARQLWNPGATPAEATVGWIGNPANTGERDQDRAGSGP